MKKIFKKNQVIITALAIMIAVAGYINYSDTHLGMDKVLQKTGAVSDTSDTEAQETAGTDGIVEEIDSLDYDLTDESALLEEMCIRDRNRMLFVLTCRQKVQQPSMMIFMEISPYRMMN